MMMIEQSSTKKSTAPIVIGYATKCRLCGELHINSFMSIPRPDTIDTTASTSNISFGKLIPISIPCWIAKLLRDRGHQL